MKKIRFYFRCIKHTWKDKDAKICRQKLRRLARDYAYIGKSLGVCE